MGLADESVRLNEQAHRRLLAEGRPREAAMAAMGVAATHFLRGESAAGSGWLGRAARLLADQPEGIEHGLILYFTQVEGALDGPDPQPVIDAARRVQRIGKEHNDAGLTAMGILGEGRALVRQGQVARGLALLDAPTRH